MNLPPFDPLAFVSLFLDEPWHDKCEIVPDYMPPFPRPDTKSTVRIRYNNGTDHPAYLRYSSGPKQEYFWDIYGDDMHTVELAMYALIHAPAPRNVGPIVIKLSPRSTP